MKYIFLGPRFKPAVVLYQEVYSRQDVQHYDNPFRIGGCQFLYKYLKSSAWIFKYLFRSFEADEDEEVIFIYFNPWVDFCAKTGCVDYLRKKYKKSFHVVSLLDIHVARTYDMGMWKDIYDKVYIYDESEAENLGISYYPACYSKNHATPDERKEIYDIAFVGQAKHRYAEIIKVFERASSVGLKCNFYIVGVDAQERKYADTIKYGNVFLGEEEYFNNYIVNSKCLLEIQLHATQALTARVREAVMYDKKLLSNNASLLDYKYYRSDMMQVYTNVDEIDFSFLHGKKGTYEYSNDFSPTLFLNELERQYDNAFKA